jgi:ferritin-like metal-binding protein YciE
MTLNSLQDVFVDQLADLYSAERQILQALPGVAAAANDADLRQAIEDHRAETQNHVTRLEQIFGQLSVPAPAKTCQGMKGLLTEGDEVVKTGGAGPAKDAALIAAAQRVEHYEIAAYGTARTMARELGLGEVESLLDETLGEESNADDTLTRLAIGGIFSSGINENAMAR